MSVDGRLLDADADAAPLRRREFLRAPAVVAGVVAALAGAAVLVPSLQPRSDVASVRPAGELPVTAMDQGFGPSNNSPVIVEDPTNDRFVVMANRLDAPYFSCALQVSGDGGRTWAPARPISELPQGADNCYAPEVAFDRDGNLYYLFVGLSGPGNEPMGAFLTVSGDRGATFTPPRQVLGPLNFGVRMAIDPTMGRRGRIHLLWLHASSDPPLGGMPDGPNPILTAHSDDAGETFSEPVRVSDPSRSRVVAPALALGPDHNVYVAYLDLVDDARDYKGLEGPVWDGTWSLLLARSTDGGRTFSPAVVVDDDIAPSERVMLIFTMAPPSLVATSSRVCAGWTDARHGDPDVLVQCMRPGEAPRGEPVRVNDDPVGNGYRQYLPRLSLSPDGRLDAVFFDRRGHPENFVNDVFYSYSSDGGRGFAPNVRLTSDGSDARIGQQYVGAAAEGQVEWGARLGLLSKPGRVVAAWPDTRNSRPNTTGQDLFVGEVELRHQAGARWPAFVGVGLVILGGLSIAVTVLRRSGLVRP